MPWNVAAAITRIAPLRKSANISATVESMTEKPTASCRLFDVVAVLPRLHDRRVQVQVVRHDRRAEDADRDVEHVGIADDLGARQQPLHDAGQVGPGEPQLDRERPGDARRSAGRQSLRRSGTGSAAGQRTSSTSADVRHTPHIIGRPNSRFSAIAAPITSARSHAAIAISQSSQRTIVVLRE